MSYNEGVAPYSLGRFHAALATFEPLGRLLIATSGAQDGTRRLRLAMMRVRIGAARGDTDASCRMLREVPERSAHAAMPAPAFACTRCSPPQSARSTRRPVVRLRPASRRRARSSKAHVTA